jgi:hypothetical protein
MSSSRDIESLSQSSPNRPSFREMLACELFTKLDRSPRKSVASEVNGIRNRRR